MVEVFDAWQSGQLAATSSLPLAPGLMIMMVGSRQVVVDANDYRISAGDEAVVCAQGGKVSILRGPLDQIPDAPYLGARFVLGPWRRSRARGIGRGREGFTVLGRLVQPSEGRRLMI